MRDPGAAANDTRRTPIYLLMFARATLPVLRRRRLRQRTAAHSALDSVQLEFVAKADNPPTPTRFNLSLDTAVHTEHAASYAEPGMSPKARERFGI